MNLVPLYKANNNLLVGLAEDHLTDIVNDSLVVELNLKKGEIVNGPWSGQKKIKFGLYYPIEKEARSEFLHKIEQAFSKQQIKEIEELLLKPTKEEIESLIWVPERLKNLANNYKNDIKDAIERLINIRHQIFEKALNYAMKNELRSIDEAFEDGDIFRFELRHLDNAEDINLQLLVDLIKKIETTVESLANLNKIDLDKFDI